MVRQQADPSRVQRRGGFSLLDIKRFAESRGYGGAGFRNLGLEELLGMRSPIVPIEEYGSPHFVVVRGLRDGQVDIADPAFGNRRMSVARFNSVWKDGIGFVISRPQ
jgi:predicted double-glycine peptidase